MNTRLDLAQVVSRLLATVTAGRIGHCYEVDYLKSYTKDLPAVWVTGQRVVPADNGAGWSGRVKQHCRVEFAVQIVVVRNAPGLTDAAADLAVLHDAVIASLLGWKPDSAEDQCVLVSTTDGPPDLSLMTCELIFATRTTYQREVSP